MTENEVIEIVREYASSQFPKTCNCCGKHYETFATFVRDTTYVGKPISYDAELKNWQPRTPLGTVGLVDCICGSTLALSSRNMDLTTLWRLMRWGRKEAKRRGITIRDLLEDIRSKVDQSLLQEKCALPETSTS